MHRAASRNTAARPRSHRGLDRTRRAGFPRRVGLEKLEDRRLLTAAPPTTLDVLDFGDLTLSGYGQGRQDISGIVEVQDEGRTVRITGNRWKMVELPEPQEVSAQTVLEFDYFSQRQGELHLIGLDDNDNEQDSERSLFRLHGTQTWGLSDFRVYTLGSWQHFRIPVGAYLDGPMSHLVLALDQDAAGVLADASFANVAVYDVPQAPAPREGTTPLDFSAVEVLSYGDHSGYTQDVRGAVVVRDEGRTLGITGNRWKRIPLPEPQQVTPQTVLEFDYYSGTQGELHLAGLDNDGNEQNDPQAIFQLHGTQSWGLSDYRTHIVGQWQHFRIPVGAFLAGEMSFLVLAVDQDAAGVLADASFANVAVYDAVPAPWPDATANQLDFSKLAISSYGEGRQDRQGTTVVRDDGATLNITGNRWKRVELPYPFEVNAQTVLEFDYRSDLQGELHLIGLDDDANEQNSSGTIFRLHGTQYWGRSSTPAYTLGQWQHFRIPVGEYFQGTMTHLVLAVDQDAAGVAAEASFSNVALFDAWSVQACDGCIEFVLQNRDKPGEGFYDTTSTGGTTLGQLRRGAFLEALSIWSGLLPAAYKNETIYVNAAMDSRPVEDDWVTLGQAGPNIWPILNVDGEDYCYGGALANHLLQRDPYPGVAEIFVQLNSDVDNAVVLGDVDWYYGLDGQPGNDRDFVTTVLHEVTHGLNFIDLILANGQWNGSLPGPYEQFLVNGQGQSVMTLSPAARATAATTGLSWNGAYGKAANAGIAPPLYTPSKYDSGSSVSHLDEATFVNELMSPFYSGPDHTPGAIALGMLRDMGWHLGVAQASGGGALVTPTGAALKASLSSVTTTLALGGSAAEDLPTPAGPIQPAWTPLAKPSSAGAGPESSGNLASGESESATTRSQLPVADQPALLGMVDMALLASNPWVPWSESLDQIAAHIPRSDRQVDAALLEAVDGLLANDNWLADPCCG